jgi:hypothetical protein
VRIEGADVQICAPSCIGEYFAWYETAIKPTIPSPMDEMLCASLGRFGSPILDSLSLDPISVGLRGTSELNPAVEFFRQTNLSKSCSSLQSRSPMCMEQVLLWSGRSRARLFTELTSAELVGATFRLLPTSTCQHIAFGLRIEPSPHIPSTLGASSCTVFSSLQIRRPSWLNWAR